MNPSFFSPIGLIDRSRTEAPWLSFAFREQGVKEERGVGHSNPRIIEYISSFSYLKDLNYMVRDPKNSKTKVPSGFLMGDIDDTPWCACFVAWCLRKAGQPTIGMNAGAEGWMNFGLPLEVPRLGAIAVVFKPPKKANAATTRTGYHVAFYLSGPAHGPTLFGGNQGNKVGSKSFHGWF